MASVEEEHLDVKRLYPICPGGVFGGGGLRWPQMRRSVRFSSQPFEESRRDIGDRGRRANRDTGALVRCRNSNYRFQFGTENRICPCDAEALQLRRVREPAKISQNGVVAFAP